MWEAFVVAFALTAAVSDACSKRIPNVFTTFGFLAGLAFHWFAGGFFPALMAAFMAFAIGLALFQCKAIGGGDVKLMTALGALLGPAAWARAMEIAVFFAAIIALAQLIRRRRLLQAMSNLRAIVRTLVTRGMQPHPTANIDSHQAVGAPFGVAAALGTLAVMLL